jgi:hypothetical protein
MAGWALCIAILALLTAIGAHVRLDDITKR